MSKPLELQVVSSGNTVWDRIDEYASTCLGRGGQHARDAAVFALSEFSKYLASEGVSPRSLNAYGEHLYGTGIKHTTVKNRFQAVRGFLRWCWRMKHTKEPLYEYLPRLRPHVFEQPRIILHEEYLRLRGACQSEPEKDWIIVLAYHTGLRLGDCCHLKWDDLDRVHQVIKCIPRKNRWKTGKPTYIPWISGSDLATEIDKRWLTRDAATYTGMDYISHDMALCYSDGDSASIVHVFRKVFRKAKVTGRTFKHFRATWETRMANTSGNMALIASMTGRSDMRTLLRYVRVQHDAAKAVVAAAMDAHMTQNGF